MLSMKNIKIFILLLVLSFCACSSNKAAVPVKEEFIVSLDSRQVELGVIEGQLHTTPLLPMLKKSGITVIYFPEEDAVCLRYKMELYTFHQFWSYSGREEFLKALEKYNKDFTDRNLKKGGARKSKRSYGTVEGYLIWQLAAITIRARANVNLEMGYAFAQRSPYFTINQREAEFEHAFDRSNNRTSSQIPIYFTRAQAAELAALFDPDLLSTILPEPIRRIEPTDVDYDEY